MSKIGRKRQCGNGSDAHFPVRQAVSSKLSVSKAMEDKATEVRRIKLLRV